VRRARREVPPPPPTEDEPVRHRPFRTAVVAVAVAALTFSTGFTLLAGPDDGKMRYLQEVAAGSPAWVQALPATSAECEDGMALVFPCENIDLAAIVSLPELGGPTGNDVWGWVDPENGDEYAIMGTSAGTAFVDVTDPSSPDVVAIMPSQSMTGLPLWRDIKVYEDHAYVVSEHSGHGMQVFDLTRLREGSALGVVGDLVTPDAVYFGPDDTRVSNSHNVWINEETGFAYLIGTNTCRGGLHMVDLSDPLAPTFAGCFADDGYTHDVECVVYTGPDTTYQGREICFASNEDSVTIVDVTDKAAPRMISRTEYDTSAYTHQGALTPGQDWFLFGDELDEQRTVDNTTTYILDVSDLDAPGEPVAFAHDTVSIDHNLYIDDRFVYQANYNAGLRVLEWSDELLRAGQLDEVAYFDVVPGVDIEEFAGAWSSYDFPSGTVVVSTLEVGLFVLQPDLPAAPDAGEDEEQNEDGDRPCRDRPEQAKGPKHCRS
jgi:choice-of-anchor B domain-containing protein